jgi:hypothetical protein
MDFTPLKWQAHEYEHFKRSTDWYWAVTIITLSLVALSIIFNDILLGILLLVSVFSLMLYAHRKPQVVSYEINKKGVRVDNTIYIYSTIESFWVDSHGEHDRPQLILKSSKMIMPIIVIPIETQDVHPDDIHEYLIEFLPEEEHHEPLSHKLIEYLGF